MKILVIDDNVRLAERIVDRLGQDFNIDLAHNGEQGLALCHRLRYEVIILDINLPDMTGIEVCRQLREAGADTPILMLSGLQAVDTKVELLETGADDYLTKPFNTKELRARIEALRRRGSQHRPESIINCGDLTINIDKRTVTRNEQPIRLRRKEFDVLCYLAQNKGRTLTRQMIMNHAWPDTTTSWISTIDVHIKHLRDKVDRPFRTQYIQTIYGMGYRFNDSVDS